MFALTQLTRILFSFSNNSQILTVEWLEREREENQSHRDRFPTPVCPVEIQKCTTNHINYNYLSVHNEC